MATAEGSPEPPVVPPPKEPETPGVNWAGVPKEQLVTLARMLAAHEEDQWC